MERYISKFSANGHVKLGPVRRSYSSISFAPREELIVFANQIWKLQLLLVKQSPVRQLPFAVLSDNVFCLK